MGGGKGGGGGAKIPEFVKESQKMVGERSQQLYDISKPVLGEGVKQLQSLITTGGPGAQVPIIANMETGQQRAFNAAQQAIGGDIQRFAGRAGIDPSQTRLLEQMNINQQAALQGIAPRIAAPFVSAGMGQALGGAGLAQSGFQSAAQALASGVRRPQQGGSDLMGTFGKLGQFAAGGGFGGGGKGGGGGYGATGAGLNIVGNSGMMGGGV